MQGPQRRKNEAYGRSSTARRGMLQRMPYTYGWAQLAKRVRMDEPLCASCSLHGRTIPAKHTDHIVPRYLAEHRTMDETNLQPLCKKCHDHKSWRETRGWAISWEQGPLVVISGKPGTGRHEVAERLGLTAYDFDKEAEKLGYYQPRIRRHTERALERMYQQRPQCIIVEGCALGYEIARTLKATWHHCVLPEEERLARLALR